MVTASPTPTKPGAYWAKWRIADEGTPDGDVQTPSDTWEVVTVVENCMDKSSPEYLRVSVAGQAKGQSIENFFWGPGPILPPTANAKADIARKEIIEACAKVADRWRAYWADYSQPTCAPTHDSRGGGITYGRIQAAETIAQEIREIAGTAQNNGGARG